MKISPRIALAKYFLKIQKCLAKNLNKLSPNTGLCGGWGRSGSFHPLATALVMAMKQ
jgi:hypothetical protein